MLIMMIAIIIVNRPKLVGNKEKWRGRLSYNISRRLVRKLRLSKAELIIGLTELK